MKMKNIFCFFVPYVRGVRKFQNYSYNCGKMKKDSVRCEGIRVVCIACVRNGC